MYLAYLTFYARVVSIPCIITIYILHWYTVTDYLSASHCQQEKDFDRYIQSAHIVLM